MVRRGREEMRWGDIQSWRRGPDSESKQKTEAVIGEAARFEARSVSSAVYRS